MRCGMVGITLSLLIWICTEENVVCYPFRPATFVDNETIEDQIGEGCWVRAGELS